MSKNYDRLKTYKPGQVLKYVSLNPEDKPKTIKFAGVDVFMGSGRYLNFKAHPDLECVECGLKGTFFALEKHKYQRTGKYHFNCYGLDPETGEEVMLTKDHIKPRAKGGTDTLDNYQVMCSRCNAAKGDNWLSAEQLIHKARFEENKLAQKQAEKILKNLEKRENSLKETCPHDFIIMKAGLAKCSICGKDGGWYCSKSPIRICEYEDGSTTCMHCGQESTREILTKS